MNIQEFLEKIKGVFSGDVAIIVIIILVGLSSFGLGRLSVLGEVTEPVKIQQNAEAAVDSATLGSSADETVSGSLVGSKNSTVYHFPWCSGAQRIAEENKVWFASIEEAQSVGYRAAKNCKGLE